MCYMQSRQVNKQIAVFPNKREVIPNNIAHFRKPYRHFFGLRVFRVTIIAVVCDRADSQDFANLSNRCMHVKEVSLFLIQIPGEREGDLTSKCRS